ncbi:MAG: Hsp33 family molecular chaperone HslO [Sulfuricellaceae bacterium]
MSRDLLQRFLFEHSAVRGEIAQLDATWQAVLERYNYPPAVRRLLGEMMAAAALLSATLKFSGALIMQIQGSGPVSLLVVECTSDLTLRATAKWQGETAENATLAELAGTGRFVITLDPGAGKQAYQGVVALEGETVAAVLEHYMAHSEQLETRLFLAADERGAAGMLLQKMPGVHDDDLDAWNRAVRLGDTLTTEELLVLSAQAIVRRLYHAEDIRLFDPVPLCFRCSCSRWRVAAMLHMMGRDEVLAILKEQNAIEVHCEFCNQLYAFDAVDAEQLFAAEIIAPARQTRH